MCQAESIKYLQKGMNFRKNAPNSIFLMSRRPDALYSDRIEEEGRVLIYQGHDNRESAEVPDPAKADQPLEIGGKPTDNGKFFAAAMAAKKGMQAHRVHVWEKVRTNVWVFIGAFALVDAWTESDGRRMVCKFKLRFADEMNSGQDGKPQHNRVIPPHVIAEVWKRDEGKCRKCGSTTNLHYDHILPFSRGGTSLLAENIQLLCATHNLQKSDKLE